MARLREVEEYVVTNRARAEMIDHAACAIDVRDFPPLISDEPPSRGGQNTGQSPLELLLASLCACTNVTAGRMAEKLRSTPEAGAGWPTFQFTTGPCDCR
jgi:hypothetical protein